MLTTRSSRFLARRLVYSLVVLLGVLVVVFALVHLVPGDPVRIALGTRYTPEAYDALRSASGLDRPIVDAVLQLPRLGAAPAISASASATATP